MSEVLVKEEIGAPAAAVWELVGDFGGLTKWAEGIQSCEVEGEGVGAVRTLAFGGMQLKERLEAYDADGHTLSYAIIGETPLPFSNYLSVIKLSESGGDACTIEWKGTFEPNAGAEDAARGVVQNIYTSSVKALKKKLGV